MVITVNPAKGTVNTPEIPTAGRNRDNMNQFQHSMGKGKQGKRMAYTYCRTKKRFHLMKKS